MLGLPKATELSKQLPKNAIYAKFQMNTAEKAKIDADISRITIVNEVSAEKVHIATGDQVKSFFVLLVALKKKDFDDKTIITISKLIPQNMLLVLECGDEAKLATYHTKLMQTEWKRKEALSVELKGLNLDSVWENIIMQILCMRIIFLKVWMNTLLTVGNLIRMVVDWFRILKAMDVFIRTGLI